MQYFHIFKTLGFLSLWTLICWFFFAGEKNISDQVKVVMILIGLHLKTAFPQDSGDFRRNFEPTRIGYKARKGFEN